MTRIKCLYDSSEVSLDFGQMVRDRLSKDDAVIVDDAITSLSDLQSDAVLDMVVLILYASADGTADRSVRKFTKALSSASTCNVKDVDFCLFLLGGATCYNSASQMKEQVYRSGRKVGTALQQEGATVFEQVEFDCELEDALPVVEKVVGACLQRVRDKSASNDSTGDQDTTASVEKESSV